MKRISTYIVTLVLALAGSSCSDYLDKEYDASLSEKKVFMKKVREGKIEIA